MDGFYTWVKNIVYYLLFMTMLVHLIPSGKYEKYMKLFSGCILILLMLQPLTKGLRLEDSILRLFHDFSFEGETGEIMKNVRRDLEKAEQKRLEELFCEYESAAKEDIRRIAKEYGTEADEVLIQMESDPNEADFGKISHVELVLKNNRGKTEQKIPEKEEKQIVDPIRIEVAPEEVSRQVSALGKAEREEIGIMQREISRCYQLEAENVEIRLEDE